MRAFQGNFYPADKGKNTRFRIKKTIFFRASDIKQKDW